MNVRSLAQTESFVRRLAHSLGGGDVLALVGPLGAGKTATVQMLAAALGVKQRPRSPTYTLLQPYPLPREVRGIRTLVHVDAYRVTGADLLDSGLAEYLADPTALVAVEWADRVADMLPPTARWLRITPGATPTARNLQLTARKRSVRRGLPHPERRLRAAGTAPGRQTRRRG